ncbi:hypothetical protein JYK22_35355, partial [Nonomuraea sp. RK-328]|nr:hypothetical protein [Nonomuraea sp. RK-328]
MKHHGVMYEDIPPRYRDILRHHYVFVEHREFFCCRVITPLTLGEAVRRIGMEEKDLLPAEGHDTWAEAGCLLIGQVGPAVVTFDYTGTGRFLRNADVLTKGCDHGMAQWDFHDLTFGYSCRDGGGAGWDEGLRGSDEVADPVAELRAGP